MKYEEIEVGEKYKNSQFIEQVVYKHGLHRQVVSFDKDGELEVWGDFEYEDWQPLNPKLPETGLICATDDSLLIMRTGSESGYGFDYLGQWMNHDSWSFETNPDYWRPATKEDKKRWIEWLAEEAKRRGLKKGVKIESLFSRSYYVLGGNLGVRCTDDGFWMSTKGDRSRGMVMRDGKWADIIEDEKPTQNEIDKVLKHFETKGFGMYKTKDIEAKVELLEQLKNYKEALILKTVENLDKVIKKLRKEY